MTPLEALRAAVAERGEDYIYDDSGVGCVYIKGEEPGCLVGLALSKMGATNEMLEAFDTSEDATDILAVSHHANWSVYPEDAPQMTLDQPFPEETAKWFLDNVDADSVDVLAAAQASQDMGDTWGRALQMAEDRARELGVS